MIAELYVSATGTLVLDSYRTDYDFTRNKLDIYSLYVDEDGDGIDGVWLPVADAEASGRNSSGAAWDLHQHGQSWAAGDTVQLRLALRPAAPTLDLQPRNEKIWAVATGPATTSAFQVQHKPSSDSDWSATTTVAAEAGKNPFQQAVDQPDGLVRAIEEITGLTNGIDYDVRARALNHGNPGDWTMATTSPFLSTYRVPATSTVEEDDLAEINVSVAYGEDIPDGWVRFSAQTHEGTATSDDYIGGTFPLFVPVKESTTLPVLIRWDLLAEEDETFTATVRPVGLDKDDWSPETAGADTMTITIVDITPHLTALSASVGTSTFFALDFNETFDPNTRRYTAAATLDNEITHVKLRPTVNDADSIAKVGTSSDSLVTTASDSDSAPIELVEGQNEIVVEVSDSDAPSGSPGAVEYTVVIIRRGPQSSDASLSGLMASGATNASGPFTPLGLSPTPFAAATKEYTATVGSAVSYVRLRPTVSYASSTVVVGRSDGSLAATASGSDSAPIALNVGENRIVARVTAEDGMTTDEYTVVVTRKPPPQVRIYVDQNPVNEGRPVKVRAQLSGESPGRDLRLPLLIKWGKEWKNGQVVNYGDIDQGDLYSYGIVKTTVDGSQNKYVSLYLPSGVSVNAGAHRRAHGIQSIGTNLDGDMFDETFTVMLDPDNPSWPPGIEAASPSSVKVTIKDAGYTHPGEEETPRRPRQGDDSRFFPLDRIEVCWDDEASGDFAACTPAHPASYGYRVLIEGTATHVKIRPTAKAGVTVKLGRVTYSNCRVEDNWRTVCNRSAALTAVASGEQSAAIAVDKTKIVTNVDLEVTYRANHETVVKTYLLSIDPPIEEQTPQGKYADLIAKIKQWRNDPRHVNDKSHTDRWDRALLAFGETVSDTTLTAMPASEAQGYADRGWTRWEDVAEALKDLETATEEPQDLGQPPSQDAESRQAPPNRAPTVAAPLADVSGLEAGATREVSLSGVFSDGDGDALTVSAASSNQGVATVTVSSDGSGLTVSGVSEGTATITVTARDPDGSQVSDRFSVSVVKTPEPEPTPTPTPTPDPTPTPTPEPTSDSPLSGAAARYDANGDGKIEHAEYRRAVDDHVAGKITYAELLEVIHAMLGIG